MSPVSIAKDQPLQSLDEVEDFFKARYPDPAAPQPTRKPVVGYSPDKQENEFRNYEADARPTVREFYRLNHQFQTRDFVLAKKKLLAAFKLVINWSAT